MWIYLVSALLSSLAFGDDFKDCTKSFVARKVVHYEWQAADICKLANPDARECVAEYYQGQKKVRFMADALFICQHRSRDTRECLLNYTNDEAPFDLPEEELNEIAPILRAAVPLCEISNRQDRACVLKQLRTNLRWPEIQREREVRKLYVGCLKYSSDELESCRRIVTRAVGPQYVNRVCAQPNFEVRACLIEKLRAPGSLPQPIGTFQSLCETEFLSNLLKPLAGDTHGYGCEFKP